MALGATAADGPGFYLPGGNGQTLIRAISDNGKWLLGYTNTEDGEAASGGIIINSDTKEEKSVNNELGSAMVYDLTDDGKMVVGSSEGLPARYDADSDKWTYLDRPSGAMGGCVLSVTPDGTRGCGYVQKASADKPMGVYEAAVWDLTTGHLVDTSDAIRIDLSGEDQQAGKFTSITPD